MSTDRELMVLVAKAIGGTLSEGHTKVRTGETWADWKWVGEPGVVTPESWKPNGGVVIRPLHDDGDAFRLAMLLRLCHGCDGVKAHCEWWGRDGITLLELQELVGNDPCAASRRVIVRAAAEIAKGMP